ncbi:RsmB/NOP family class I SAM-dependent RNA methyltransferase [Xanthobacteraceae bacterium Astr-EGSB]|uniref:RsmB/NOP family class I SAM-dependent RNA methyltransferase n=1 Tax=Astrobacterium formosum TaxID=3069710 RepID=UPI0027B51F9A|nr:RsmB/NOP family class I SAM-dependent RNA methyltransferase [Xanthobacteraceae bacterium Astr-EGSB]
MIRTRQGPSQADVPGLQARRTSADIIDGVLRRGRPLDEQIDGHTAHGGFAALADRDRALVRRIVATVLRRLGTLRYLVGTFLERGLPADAPRVETALLIGAAQIIMIEIPDHAAVDLSVRLVQADRRSARYAGLVNAVLRRVAQMGRERLAAADTITLDTPAWLLDRWSDTYGSETARSIAAANGQEPALDLTVRGDPAHWAERLRGRVLPTGTVRTIAHGPVPLLPGFSEGVWWVQDAAAALPVRLLGEVAGHRVADLCAAPGGKTLQLAQAGATVTAVDRSEMRLGRLRDNLQRLHLEAKTIAADAAEFEAEPFDAVLVDAPCSSTGTIRRHPDIPWLKQPSDITALSELQGRLIARGAALTRAGGQLLYCVCSLEPEEGEKIVEGFLAAHSEFRRDPISENEINGLAGMITPAGELRTLPCHWPADDPRLAGLDGFFAARLRRV